MRPKAASQKEATSGDLQPATGNGRRVRGSGSDWCCDVEVCGGCRRVAASIGKQEAGERSGSAGGSTMHGRVAIDGLWILRMPSADTGLLQGAGTGSGCRVLRKAGAFCKQGE